MYSTEGDTTLVVTTQQSLHLYSFHYYHAAMTIKYIDFTDLHINNFAKEDISTYLLVGWFVC